MDFDIFLCRKSVFEVPEIVWSVFWRHTTLYNVKNDVNLCMILRKLLKSRFFAAWKCPAYEFLCFPMLIICFLDSWVCFKRFFTSYDATQRKKRRQFMYDFKKITKISSFVTCKWPIYIWMSMFSYVENPCLRFLRFF